MDCPQECKGHESPSVTLHQPGVGPRFQVVCRKVPSNCVTGESCGREHTELPTTAAGGEGQSCDSHVTSGTVI